MDELVKLSEPQLPINWQYETSIQFVSDSIFKWRNLTQDIANELWIARKMLSNQGKRTDLTSEQKFRSWAEYCEEIGSSKQVVNRWLKQWFGQEKIEKTFVIKELPVGVYDLIYCDPPWQYDFSETDNRKIENQYPTMSVEEICNMQLPQIADNSLLLIWGTAPKLVEALQVIEAWGFIYKTHGIWDKEKIGMGYWFRGQHELLLIATKGNFPPPDSNNRKPSVFRENRTEHSKKPDFYYKWIEETYPNNKAIELFARKKYSNYWTAWGNE